MAFNDHSVTNQTSIRTEFGILIIIIRKLYGQQRLYVASYKCTMVTLFSKNSVALRILTYIYDYGHVAIKKKKKKLIQRFNTS